MKKPIFQFGNVVVVDGHIGVIVKSWEPSITRKVSEANQFNHDVYVRSCNDIHNFNENEIDHYVYSKELSDDEREFYG